MPPDDAPHLRSLAVIAHDLRGRLGAALLSTEMLRQQLSGAGGDIGTDVTSLRSLLQDCVLRLNQRVTLERLRSNAIRFSSSEVDLSDLAHVLASRFADTARLSNIRLTVTGSGIARTDRGLLEQLAANLIDNALRHSQGTAVTCHLVGVTSGGWSLEVADDGVGISPGSAAMLTRPESPGFLPEGPVGLRVVRGLLDVLGGRATLGAAGSADGPGTAGPGTRIRVDSSPPLGATDNHA